MLEDLQLVRYHLKLFCSARVPTSELTLALTLWNEAGTHLSTLGITANVWCEWYGSFTLPETDSGTD